MTEEFVIALGNRYDALYNGSDDEQEWSKIKEMYSSMPTDLRGTPWKAKKKEEVMDE